MSEDPRSLEERLVIEPGQVEFNEHSKHSGAKKVIGVFPSLAIDPADAKKTIDPVESVAASGSFPVVAKSAYRLISDGALRIRLTTDAGGAAATDTYIPADTPVIIKAGQFLSIDFIRTGGAFTQIVKVR